MKFTSPRFCLVRCMPFEPLLVWWIIVGRGAKKNLRLYLSATTETNSASWCGATIVGCYRKLNSLTTISTRNLGNHYSSTPYVKHAKGHDLWEWNKFLLSTEVGSTRTSDHHPRKWFTCVEMLGSKTRQAAQGRRTWNNCVCGVAALHQHQELHTGPCCIENVENVVVLFFERERKTKA